jgi:hypothetical protein
MVPLCIRKDSSTRKPAKEPLPAIQMPSGEATLALVVAVFRGGSCNGGAVGPVKDPGKMNITATKITRTVTMPMMIHLTIFPIVILKSFL